MPWIDEGKCTGCNVCVEKCSADAISMEDEKAKINMQECIRCGICHSVCPQEAVRHDSKKIPAEIKVNVEKTKTFMEACVKHLGDDKEGQKCLNRMIKYFNKEKLVAEKTMEELKKLSKESEVDK